MLHVHWLFWKTYCALRKSEVPDFRLSVWVEASWILRFASFLSILFLYPSNKEKPSFKLSLLLLLAWWQLACQMSWSVLADTETAQLKCSQLNKSPLSQMSCPFLACHMFLFQKKPSTDAHPLILFREKEWIKERECAQNRDNTVKSSSVIAPLSCFFP